MNKHMCSYYKDNLPETGVVTSFLATTLICFSSCISFFGTPGTLKGKFTNKNHMYIVQSHTK